LRYPIIIVAVFQCISISAQISISGYVTTIDGEPIIGAHIYYDESTGTVTNEYGFYSISVEANSKQLHCTHVSYESSSHHIDSIPNGRLNFHLEEKSLEEIVVSNSVNRSLRDRIQLSSVTLAVDRLKAVPSLMGEQDIIKALTILPGVSTGLEGTSGLYVRGGTPDQNLLLLDNAPVYNVSHLFGLFTVFNPDAVKNVELHKGAIPARYGDRLSSVVSINMKEGNLKKWKKKYSMGLVSSSFIADGPIKKDTTSLLIAARGSYLSLVSLPLRIAYETLAGIESFGDYRMYDINAKLSHKIDENKKVFVNFYAGRDHQVGLAKTGFENIEKDASGYTWGNITGSIRKTNQVSSKLFIQDQLIFTRFSTNFFSRHVEISPEKVRREHSQERLSIISEYSYSKQFNYWTSKEHWIKGGVDMSYRKATPLKVKFSSSFPDVTGPEEQKLVIHGLKGALFVEDNWKIGDRIILDLGMRYQWYFVQQKHYHSFEPRMSFGLSLSDELVFNASYSRTSQSIHGLSGAYDVLPIQGWVNSSKETPIQRADLFSSGFGLQTSKFDLRFEGYYRLLYDQLDFQRGFRLLSGLNTNYEDIVERGGKGWAYGFETFLDKKYGRFTYIISYTLSWNQRQFPEISLGRKYYHQYDQRHNLSIFTNWNISNNWSLTSLFQYNTGRRQSIPVASIPSPDGTQDLYISSERNNLVAPNYHRLDLSASYRWVSKKRKRDKVLIFNVYNSYFKKNGDFYRFRDSAVFDENDNYVGRELRLKVVSILPILPSFTYIIDFNSL